MNVRVDLLDKVVDDLRADLKDGLLATDIWQRSTGVSLASWQTQPEATSLFNRMSHEIESVLVEAQYPPLDDYYYLDLEGSKGVAVIYHGPHLMQGMLLDSSKVNTGTLFALSIRRCLQGVREAIES